MARLWTTRTTPAMGSDRVVQLVYGNGVFCCIDSAGFSYVSSDQGDTWLRTNTGIGSNVEGLAFNGTNFCAIARFSGRCRTSPDGITWSANIAMASSFNIVGAFGKFFAVGDSGLATSTTGASWSLTALSIPFTRFIGLCGSTLIIGSSTDSDVLTSPDGVTWTKRTKPGPTGATAWDGSKFVAFATGGDTQNIYTSPDAITWSLQAGVLPIATSLDNPTVVVDGGQVLYGGGSGTGAIIYSENGVDSLWSTSAVGGSDNYKDGAGAVGDGVVMYIASVSDKVVTTPSLDIPVGEFWTNRIKTQETI